MIDENGNKIWCEQCAEEEATVILDHGLFCAECAKYQEEIEEEETTWCGTGTCEAEAVTERNGIRFCSQCAEVWDAAIRSVSETIEISVEGGLIQDIKKPNWIKVIVRDYDDEYCDEERLEKDADGRDCVVSEW